MSYRSLGRMMSLQMHSLVCPSMVSSRVIVFFDGVRQLIVEKLSKCLIARQELSNVLASVDSVSNVDTNGTNRLIAGE